MLKRRYGVALLVGLLLGSGLGVDVRAQGPYSAQIQRALNAFVGAAHTWTALQTFSGGAATTGPSIADKFCLDATNKDTYFYRAAANDVRFVTGATNCAVGTDIVRLNASGIILGTGGLIAWGSSGVTSADVIQRRSAAKTWTIDADGALAPLTDIQLVGTTHVYNNSAGATITFNGNAGTITSNQGITAQNSNITATTGGFVSSNTNSALTAGTRGTFGPPADGVWQVLNNAGTSLTRFILGTNDATTSGVSIGPGVNGGLAVKKGDGSAFQAVAVSAVRGTDDATTGLDISNAKAGNTGSAWRIITSMGTPSSPSNGDWWVESNTGAVTGASGALKAQLNGATVLIAPSIRGENISGTQTANFTALTQSPTATAGRWECSAVVVSDGGTNTGTFQVTLDYVNANGITHTADILPIAGAAGTVAATSTDVASKEFFTVPKRFTVDNSNTNIVMKVVITGTVSYKVSPRCWQEA